MADTQPTGYILDPVNVPLAGPDPFTNDEKADAVESAEEKLEADINDGNDITDPTALHGTAVNAYATYVLATGPAEPGSQYSGDYADAGQSVMEFAREMLAIYRDTLSSIQGSQADDPMDKDDPPVAGDEPSSDGPQRADTAGRIYVTHRGKHDPDKQRNDDYTENH